MIKVGDEIINHQGISAPITKLKKGRYGLFIEDEDRPQLRVFAPYELPPIEEQTRDWYGWCARDFIVLPNGKKLGVVCFDRSDHRAPFAEEYDLEWERTIEQMREEQADELQE